jgi:endonuclease/exonuclease/phosphatase (EEP) superfamily protein YafD
VTRNVEPLLAPESKGRPPLKVRLWNALVAQVWRLTIAASVLSVAGLFAHYAWLCDLCSHFRLQYAVCLGLATLLFLLARQVARFGVAGGFAVFNAALIAPLYIASPDERPSGTPWRAVTINLQWRNPEKRRVIECVRELQPDVALFLEVSPAWSEALESLRDDWPYSTTTARQDSFGIALYSRHPFTNVKTLPLGLAEIPAILGQVNRRGSRVTFLGVHALPPNNSDLWRARNQNFKEAAKLAAAHEGPSILFGDLNCTPWSSSFHELVRESGLRDSEVGAGIQASWHTKLPGMRIPIDHFLVSGEVVIRNRFVGPYLGSDHFPVVLEFAVADSGRGP